jgi:hypothetical protein
VIIRGEPDVSASLDPFLHRLADTASWCTPRADVTRPATCLRDPHTQPRRLEGDYFSAVSTVASRRYHGAAPARGTPRRVENGRLMVYFPDADLCDGAAEVETDGYFDVFNTPPWDTWVGFFRDDRAETDAYVNYLVAWVPPVFVELVARGIEVNPEQCIRWLDETDCGLSRRIAGKPSPDRGLISRIFRRG